MSSDYEAINYKCPYLTQVTLGRFCLDVPIPLSVFLPAAAHPLVFCAPVLSGIKSNMVVSLPVEN
jgi:hypothetical protein